MVKYGDDYEANESDWYSALDFCCEYADSNDDNESYGYWAEDIVMEAMPSAYEPYEYENTTNKPVNGGDKEGGGYYAMDILSQ